MFVYTFSFAWLVCSFHFISMFYWKNPTKIQKYFQLTKFRKKKVREIEIRIYTFDWKRGSFNRKVRKGKTAKVVERIQLRTLRKTLRSLRLNPK